MQACFTIGTLIETDHGPVAVESLSPRMLVMTQDAGLQRVRRVARRRISATEQASDSSLCPVILLPGSLGDGLPERGLAVSPQYRMLMSDWRCQLYFAETEVLIAAKALEHGVTYAHFLLDGHQIVMAGGVPSESFYPSLLLMTGDDAAARDALLRLFPDLPLAALPMTRPVPRMAEARALAG